MRLQQRQARETGICPVRRQLYTQCFGIYKHICTHVRTHARTHARTHTHTHTQREREREKERIIHKFHI